MYIEKARVLGFSSPGKYQNSFDVSDFFYLRTDAAIIVPIPGPSVNWKIFLTIINTTFITTTAFQVTIAVTISYITCFNKLCILIVLCIFPDKVYFVFLKCILLQFFYLLPKFQTKMDVCMFDDQVPVFSLSLHVYNCNCLSPFFLIWSVAL